MDHLLTCPVCFEPFDSDLSIFVSEKQRRESHLPVLSHQCPHKICASCLNNWQHRAVSKRAKQLPKWFKCPCCAKRTAFDAEEMEIDTFACTMFAHVKANGSTVQSSAERHLVLGTNEMQSSESFLEQGSARRTEFYYHNHPTPAVEDADQTLLVQHRSSRSRSTSSGASRRKRDLVSALDEGKDTDEIRTMLDREDALTSTERFLESGTSRRSMRVWSGYHEHCAELERTRWKCQGCGKINSSKRKRCPPPCFKWKPGLRTGGKKYAESEMAESKIHGQSRKRGDDDDDVDNLRGDEGTIEADAVSGKDLGRWECPSCKQISPFRMKLCSCKSTRNGQCAIPDCPKFSQNSRYNHMCKKHYLNSTAGDLVPTSPNPRQQSTNICPARLKNPYTGLKRRDKPRRRTHLHCGSCDSCMVDDCGRCSHCLVTKRFGRNGVRRQNCLNRPPCCDPPSASTPGMELKHDSDENTRNQSRKRKRRHGFESQDVGADIGPNAEVAEENSEGTAVWKCRGCGKTHPSERKRCPPPCFNWKNGQRKWKGHNDVRGQTKCSKKQHSNDVDGDGVLGRKTNPYADRKRRDSPRQRTRYCCGSCDACMVDDCGECRHCVDMKKFGGSKKVQKKCMNLPPCYKTLSVSLSLDADFAETIERKVHSDEEEAEGKEVREEEKDDDGTDRLFEALSPGRYEYVPLPIGGSKAVQAEDIIVTFFTTGWERGKVEDIDRGSPSQKRVAKEFSVPRLVRYISDNSYWLHDLDDPTIYLSEEQFNNLNAGSTEASEDVKVGAWCVVRRTDSPRNPSTGILV